MTDKKLILKVAVKSIAVIIFAIGLVRIILL